MSLTEVLVALFIMAIGTIAILTLFPLGALQMGQALKDDRTAQSATQADGFMRAYWRQFVAEQGPDPFFSAFINPAAMGSPNQPNLLPIPAGGGPSYPVVIDPMGAMARPISSSSSATWVGNQNSLSASTSTTNLIRQNLQLVTQQTQSNQAVFAFRLCSLLDGLGYTTNGLPQLPNGSTIDRETRYNWLWILQQPVASFTTTTTTNMTVVVFDKRASLYAPTTAEQVFTPVICTPGTTTTTGSTQVSFALGSAPPVQKGDWLMDATVTHVDCMGITYVPPSPPPNPSPKKGSILQTPTPAVMNANFYRVVSITDNPNNITSSTPNGTTDIELQTPMLPDTMPQGLVNQGLGIPQPSQRQFIYLVGVAEVFQRPPLTFP
jgi:hypothetical protein